MSKAINLLETNLVLVTLIPALKPGGRPPIDMWEIHDGAILHILMAELPRACPAGELPK